MKVHSKFFKELSQYNFIKCYEILMHIMLFFFLFALKSLCDAIRAVTKTSGYQFFTKTPAIAISDTKVESGWARVEIARVK